MQPVNVQVGNKVLVPEYGGTKLVFDDKVHMRNGMRIKCIRSVDA